MSLPARATAARGAMAVIPGERTHSNAHRPASEAKGRYSDTELAELFVSAHQETHRYTASDRTWRRLNGPIWEQDRTLDIYDRIRRWCREVARTVDSATEAKQITSKQTVANVEFLVRSHSALAALPEQWDADPDLLAVPDGVIDLRTQTLRPARAIDYCTRMAATTPSATAKCRRWLSFLQWATQGDDETIGFLRRMMGYSLTGHTREHSLTFVHGPGGNGKTVALNVWERLLGRYATTAPVETFTASKYDRHPTELAMLHGRRLVTARETEPGRRWAEARLKQLTGGERVTARFMRGDFFSFEPTFKLVIAGNHRPHFVHIDEAIRRRLHLVPFDAKIPDGRKDPELEAKLRAEWPAILQWMLEGCAQWIEYGSLRPPERVLAATMEYLESEDPFADFIEDQCELAPLATATSADINAAWSAWAQRNRIPAGDYRDLAQRLEQRGVKACRLGKRGTRGYRGIRLRFNLRDGGIEP